MNNQPAASQNETVTITGLSDLEFKGSSGFALSECLPALGWRPAGQDAWQMDRAGKLEDLRVGDGIVSFRCRIGPCQAQIHIERLGDCVWEFSGSLTNVSAGDADLARFHYIDGTVGSTKAGLLSTSEFQLFCRMFRQGETMEPVRKRVEELWASWKVIWPRLNDPIHDAPNWGTSVDTGMITEGWDKDGWMIGFTGPGTAFGEIGFNTQSAPARFYAGMLLDNILLKAGQSRLLERAVIWHGDWQQGLAFWAQRAAGEMGVQKVRPPLVGYCSWYQKGAAINGDEFQRAVDEFASWPIAPGGRTVQLDDGFQIMPGDWRPNEKFAKHWPGLPKRISDTGSIPGLWLAPFAIHHEHPIVTEHPEWLQRLPNGEFAVSFSNWDKTYIMEVDHPGAREFIKNILKEHVAQGWRYFKLDFLYALTAARVAYDRSKTMMESLRELHALFREAVGPDILICACVGQPGRFAAGYADIARLGGDIGGDWSVVTRNLADLLLRSSTNATWWQADPDVFFMRDENTRLSPEENYLLTGTIGLLGGIFLTSDYASQWSEPSKEAVREFWNEQGPRVPNTYHVLFDEDGVARAIRVSYDERQLKDHGVGLYNWSDQPQTIRVPLEKLKLNKTLKWRLEASARNKDIQLINGELVVENQPPHSIRIAALMAE